MLEEGSYCTQIELKNMLAGILLWLAALILGIVLGSAAANARMVSQPGSVQQQNCSYSKSIKF